MTLTGVAIVTGTAVEVPHYTLVKELIVSDRSTFTAADSISIERCRRFSEHWLHLHGQDLQLRLLQPFPQCEDGEWVENHSRK
jgi:hypothetical protein